MEDSSTECCQQNIDDYGVQHGKKDWQMNERSVNANIRNALPPDTWDVENGELKGIFFGIGLSHFLIVTASSLSRWENVCNNRGRKKKG